MLRELPQLPPAVACAIPAAWTELPPLALFLARKASASWFYQLVWHADIAPGVQALRVRTGALVTWMSFFLDVSVQTTQFGLVGFPGTEEEDSEDDAPF